MVPHNAVQPDGARGMWQALALYRLTNSRGMVLPNAVQPDGTRGMVHGETRSNLNYLSVMQPTRLALYTVQPDSTRDLIAGLIVLPTALLFNQQMHGRP